MRLCGFETAGKGIQFRLQIAIGRQSLSQRPIATITRRLGFKHTALSRELCRRREACRFQGRIFLPMRVVQLGAEFLDGCLGVDKLAFCIVQGGLRPDDLARSFHRIAHRGCGPVRVGSAPAKQAAPAKAAPQATLTLKHIAAELAEGHDLTKKAAEAVLDDFVALITRQLVKGDKIRLSGLGILLVRDRPARTARNPRTGESVAVAASRKIAFRPAKELKEAV